MGVLRGGAAADVTARDRRAAPGPRAPPDPGAGHLGRRPPDRAARPLRRARCPARLAERAPRIVEDDDGVQYWLYEDRPLPQHRAQRRGRAGPGSPGAWTRRASTRCGPAASTSTPASPTWTSTACGRRCASRRWWPGSAARCSSARRTRSWAWPACAPGTTGTSRCGPGTYPERIIPLQLPWLADVDGGRRRGAAPTRRGASRRSASPSSRPSSGCPSIFSGAWDPFFAACEETSTVVCLHTGASAWAPLPSPDPPFELLPTLVPGQRAGGRGRVAVVGRAPALPRPGRGHVRGRDRLGADAARPGRLRARALRPRVRRARRGPRTCCPSEVLRRNFWFCTIDDPSIVELRHRIGVDHIMVESDYPHADSTWPDTQAVLDKTLRAPPRRRAADDGGGERGAPVPPPAAPARRLARMTPAPGPAPVRCRDRGARTGRRRRRRARGRAPRRVGGASPSRYRPRIDARPPRLRARRGGRHRDPGRAARAPWPRPGRASPTRGRSCPLDEAHPGGSRPAARLVDMDTEGIDQAVLFPSIGLYFWALDDPPRRGAHRPRLQRLAGLVLRGRPRPGSSARR